MGRPIFSERFLASQRSFEALQVPSALESAAAQLESEMAVTGATKHQFEPQVSRVESTKSGKHADPLPCE